MSVLEDAAQEFDSLFNDYYTGPATLIEDLGENDQVERVSILWSVPDRIYILSGPIGADVATAIADSVR